MDRRREGAQEWSRDDRAFLRSLRIAAADPPPPLPRFRVEPSDVAGWQYRRLRSVVGLCEAFPDPRAAAEDLARQLNEEHASQP